MSPEITVMESEKGNIFWDLPPWIVYTAGCDLGCTIYVANPSDTEKEYALISRVTSGETVISEDAIKVFGLAWFKVAPKDFVRLRGALCSDETDVVLSVLLVEKETEEIADSVFTSLVAPAVSALPPTWPESPDTSGFDWSSLLALIMPVMMLGVIVSADKPEENEKEPKPITVTEERKLLPAGRQ